jgi:hypothetical protein
VERRGGLSLGGVAALALLAACRRENVAGAPAPGITVTGDTTSPGPTASPRPAAQPWNPLTRYATFGWLPPGASHTHTSSAANRFEVRYQLLGDAHPDILSGVELEVWPSGSALWQQPGAEQYPFVATAPVGDRQAQWLPLGARTGALRWEYGTEAWAQLRMSTAGEEVLAVARRVAESVRLGAAEPIRLPWRLAAVPAGLSPASVQVIEDEMVRQPWQVELAFHGPGGGSGPENPLVALIMRAHKGPVSPNPNDRPHPDRTVADLPAELQRQSDGDLLLIYRPDDIVHTVYASREALPLLGPDGVVGFTERSQLLGGPPTWSDRPLG